MSRTAVFEVRCDCDKRLLVPETILVDIFLRLQKTAKDASRLALVCPGCAGSFLFDFHRRSEKVQGTTALPLEREVDHAWFSIAAECDPSNSCPPRILFAIRPFGTTSTELEKEFPIWSARGVSCEKGHPIVSLSLR